MADVVRGIRTVSHQPVMREPNETAAENETRWRAQVAAQIEAMHQRLEALELQVQKLGGAP